MGIKEWLSENLATLIATAVLVLIVALLVKSKIKERKKGGCGCGCPGCSGSCAHMVVENRREEKSDEAE